MAHKVKGEGFNRTQKCPLDPFTQFQDDRNVDQVEAIGKSAETYRPAGLQQAQGKRRVAPRNPKLAA